MLAAVKVLPDPVAIWISALRPVLPAATVSRLRDGRLPGRAHRPTGSECFGGSELDVVEPGLAANRVAPEFDLVLDAMSGEGLGAVEGVDAA